jgi:hypothetical protein
VKRFKGSSIGLSVAILGWLVFTANAAQAAHPLITDDAGTIGQGVVQLEITGEITRDKETLDDGTREESEAAEAALTLAYGLTEDLDFVVAIPYPWISSHSNDEPVAREHGISDLSLDLKWRIFEGDGWGLALKPGITLPTGNEAKGLGGGRTTYRLVFITTKELEPWVFHLNLGYIRNENNAGNRKDLGHASLAGEFELLKGLKAVANVGVETNPSSGSGTQPAFVLGGLVYELSGNINLDAGVKLGLTKPEADVGYLAGMTFKF